MIKEEIFMFNGGRQPPSVSPVKMTGEAPLGAALPTAPNFIQFFE